MFNLSCKKCGSKLELSEDVDSFACAKCGTEWIVKQSGGIAYLSEPANIKKNKHSENKDMISTHIEEEEDNSANNQVSSLHQPEDKKESKKSVRKTVLISLGILILISLLVIFVPVFVSYKYLDDGIQAYEQKNYTQAIQSLNSAKKFNSKNPMIYYYLGKTLSKKGDYNRAIENYRHSVKLDNNWQNQIDPLLADVYFKKAENSIKKGEMEKAVAEILEGFRIAPDRKKSDDSRTLLYQGICEQYKNKNHKKSIDYFSKSIKKEVSADAYFFRGESYLSIEKLIEAKIDFDNSLKIDPKKARIIKKKNLEIIKLTRQSAFKKINNSRFDEAIAELNQMQKLFDKTIPEFKSLLASAYLKKGEMYKNNGQYHEAIDCFETAIILKPDLAQAYFNRGETYFKLKKWDEAISDFQKAKELDPNKFVSKVASHIQTINRMKNYRGKEQYYVLGGSRYYGYVAKKHKSGTYLLNGSVGLSSKKWYQADPVNSKLISIHIPSIGNKSFYNFSRKKLEKVKVSSITPKTKVDTSDLGSYRIRYYKAKKEAKRKTEEMKRQAEMDYNRRMANYRRKVKKNEALKRWYNAYNASVARNNALASWTRGGKSITRKMDFITPPDITIEEPASPDYNNKTLEITLEAYRQNGIKIVNGRPVSPEEIVRNRYRNASYNKEKVNQIQLKRENGTTLLIDELQAKRYLISGKTYYGIIKLYKVELYVGDDYIKRTFDIKGKIKIN